MACAHELLHEASRVFQGEQPAHQCSTVLSAFVLAVEIRTLLSLQSRNTCDVILPLLAQIKELVDKYIKAKTARK